HPPGTLSLPVLGAPLDEVVATGSLALVEGPDGPEIRYHEHRFPVRPGTGAEADAGPDLSPAALREVLDRQWYRLGHWRLADEDLSYRRFFDVTDLVGVRVEDPDVFDRTHALVVELVRSGVVQGLRIDHVDGLADPRGYLDRLSEVTHGVWVVVEKILERGERLPPDWAADGTSGYEGGALVTALLHDPAGAEALGALFASRVERSSSWASAVSTAKADVIARLFRAERARLARLALAAWSPGPLGRTAPVDVEDAFTALLVAFDRYRLYAPPRGALSDADRALLSDVVGRAARSAPRSAPLLRAIERTLREGSGGAAGRELRTRLNQVAGAVMAKGVEDTALYRWVAHPGAGDVGAAPVPLGCSLAEAHEAAAHLAAWPHGLVATSTHDSKRSEDARARLALLGEVVDEWTAVVDAVAARLGAGPGAPPDGWALLVLCQSLVAAWPVDGKRLSGYLEKAAREAKRRTSWRAPDVEYETGLRAMATAAVDDDEVRGLVTAFVDRLDVAARENGLAQVLAKVALPGIPDVYRGNEAWRYDLTDPDNRRPVDHRAMDRLIETARSRRDAPWPEPQPGLAKAWLLVRGLGVRRARAEAFREGYAPLLAQGAAADHLFAFVRGHEVVALVPRFPLARARAGGWRDTTIELPPGRWRDALAGGPTREGEVAVASLLDTFPVGLLVRQPGPTRAAR
ncbi:MAG: malto-oligosyltrehalose synthase, partial [Acidimicrobiales bacterium]|nr:malto-oligosyltrehalose synthase [Acidimicrobiales bacterium]